MPKQIVLKDGSIVEDTYQYVEDGMPEGDVVVSFEQLDLLPQIKGKKAIFLTAEHSPETNVIPLDVDAIFIDFAGFNDGRGYSFATLLRRQGFKGELRAVGDIFKDILNYLKRSGFDSFVIKEGKDIVEAAKGLTDFKMNYQISTAESCSHYQTS